MDEKELNIFLEKFMKNQVSATEHQAFVDWMSSLPEEESKAILLRCSSFFEQNASLYVPQYDELVEVIEEKLDEADYQEAAGKQRPGYGWLRYAGAAAVILICSVLSLHFYRAKQKHTDRQTVAAKYRKIVPGGNKAVLTLADGQQIVLSGTSNGHLLRQHGAVVDKVKEGELIYRKQGKQPLSHNQGLQVNTLVTPRGGQYKITLPDGSMVWLNAATTLKFPSVFKGTERRVELTGEAYFEVAKNKAMPFIVSVNHTEVKVLGTHFNVMGYADEPATRTTLLEGAVKIISGSDSRDIVPGQQAIVDRLIKVRSVDTSEVVGWKNGNFTFAHERIEVVMNKIARWYDVDIQYQGKVTPEEFVGVIPRSKDLADVLHKLELTGLLKFKMKERSVIVMN